MTYQHLSQTERYQIYILMKDGKTQIAKLMERHKSTISRELARNTGLKGYRPRQACLLAEKRSQGSRNATQITAADWGKTVNCLLEKWSPVHIETRAQVGHWEGYTVIGAHHKQAVVTLVERKSGYALIAKVINKTSDLVSTAIIKKLSPMAPLVKTITFDNGKEFAGHSTIDAALNSINGLLRQYIPKKRALSTVTDKELKMIQDQLNNRPRKRLGFKTPSEVFMQSLNRVALRV